MSKTSDSRAVVYAFAFIIFIVLPLIWYLSCKGSGYDMLMRTPEIQLKFVDKKTAEPIPGLLVHVEWIQKYIGFGILTAFGGTPGRTKKEMWFMTDMAGMVLIPKVWDFNVKWGFNGLGFDYRHPMYVSGSEWLVIGTRKYEFLNLKNKSDRDIDIGKDEFTVKLASLEDKYKGILCPDPFFDNKINESTGNVKKFHDDLINSARYYSWGVYASKNEIINFSENFYLNKAQAEFKIISLVKRLCSPKNISEEYLEWISTYYTKRQ